MVQKSGVGSAKHPKLLFILIVPLWYVEMTEFALDEPAPLHTNKHPPHTAFHHCYLHPLRPILQAEIDLFGALLPRFHDYSQHKLSFHIFSAGSCEAISERITY